MNRDWLLYPLQTSSYRRLTEWKPPFSRFCNALRPSLKTGEPVRALAFNRVIGDCQ